MDHMEAIQILEKIESIYAQFRISDETITLWIKSLSGMDYNRVLQNLMSYIAKSPFPPTISDIAAFCEKRNSFLDKMKQWEQEGRERIERDKQFAVRKPLPQWLLCR